MMCASVKSPELRGQTRSFGNLTDYCCIPPPGPMVIHRASDVTTQNRKKPMDRSPNSAPRHVLHSGPPRARLLTLALLPWLVVLPLSLRAQNQYIQHNLISDLAGQADRTDTNLVNPWGI